mmetsp:Transcript_19001/g.55272  ORF Transcript_19001/g.55272 Transcript_19001/m.55272 type:complete len:84 (-) Transcript_19001:1723-1974(-)
MPATSAPKGWAGRSQPRDALRVFEGGGDGALSAPTLLEVLLALDLVCSSDSEAAALLADALSVLSPRARLNRKGGKWKGKRGT